jgi:hypothetical protein
MNLSNEDQPNHTVTIQIDAKTYASLEQLKAIDNISVKVRIQNIIRTIVSRGDLKAHTGL